MDITNELLKSMKAKQLRRLIREAIEEVLTENTAIIATKTGTKSISFEDPKELEPLRKDSNVSSIETTAGQKIKEGDLDEAKGYKLTNPEIDMSQFVNRRTGEPAKIAGILFSDILTTIRDTEGISDKQLFDKFKFNPETGIGFKKVQQLNGMMKGLKDTGIIDRIGRGGEVEATPEPGEEQPETIDGPESFLIGGGDPLAGMFDGIPNDDGSEDFNDDTEPTLGDLETDDELPSTPSTDKEKAADFTTDDANSRLIQSIINNYTTLKSRIRGSGELGGLSGSDMMTAIRSSKAAAELKFPQKMQQLIDRIKEQEPAVQKAILDSLIVKFASVKLPSLAKAIAKELNVDAQIPTIKTPIEEPEEEIEDTIDEAYNAEYEKRKLQFYAGIIK
jgi:hypothetical protein